MTSQFVVLVLLSFTVIQSYSRAVIQSGSQTVIQSDSEDCRRWSFFPNITLLGPRFLKSHLLHSHLLHSQLCKKVSTHVETFLFWIAPRSSHSSRLPPPHPYKWCTDFDTSLCIQCRGSTHHSIGEHLRLGRRRLAWNRMGSLLVI